MKKSTFEIVEPAPAVAFAVTLIVVGKPNFWLAVGCVRETVGGAWTEMFTGADVVTPPALSVATAVSE